MILLKSSNIKHALKDCLPSKIAVAYIGADWKEFIDPSNLDAIIISPTLGSNPYAIEELAKIISWEKIFFLDKLHTKFYIGNTTAILGSANLSKNGLGGSGLAEASIKTNDVSFISELRKYFEEIINQAKKEYSSTQQKKNRVSELKRQHNHAIRQSLVKLDNETITLVEYEPLAHDDFYIVWYYPGSYEYSDNIQEIKHLIANDMTFANRDEIAIGKWILAWRITTSGQPNKKQKPSWMFIDEIFDNAVHKDEDPDYPYKKLAITRGDYNDKPPVPFELDEPAISSLKKTLVKEKFRTFISQDDDGIFYVKNTFPLFENFIADLKHEYIEITSKHRAK